jgi:hypothetical protein
MKQGEIWLINLGPAIGAEINKHDIGYKLFGDNNYLKFIKAIRPLA